MKMVAPASVVPVFLALCVAPGAASRLKGNTPSEHFAAKQGESAPMVADGYTDCEWNRPVDPLWWTRSALGHKAATKNGTYQKAHYEMPNRQAAMCIPAKNGCTFWKALFMRMQGNPNWNAPEEDARHNVYKTQLEHDWSIFKDPNAKTMMLVRNPIARVLSAFLDKSGNTSGYYHNIMKDYPLTPQGFERFVSSITPGVKSSAADGHWRRQLSTCGLPEGAAWDFYLKVECRKIWGPSLFDRYNLHSFTDSGWGSDGKQSFIPTGTGAAAPTAIAGMKANDKQGTHHHRADQVNKMCKWYTESNFLAVVSLYAEDIMSFGYYDDIKRIAMACKFRLSIGFPPH